MVDHAQLTHLNSTRVRGKTVYLLGAGFSAGSGAPLLSNFIPTGLNLLKGATAETGKLKVRLLQFAVKVEATLKNYVAAAEFLPDRLVNLEDLFCLVDLRKQYDITSKPKRDEITLKQFVVEVLERAWKNHEGAWMDLKSDPGKRAGKRGTTVADDPLASKAPPVVPQRSLFDFTGRKQPDTDQFYNACAYEAFLSKVLHDNEQKKSGAKEDFDFIITLNYDLVIERKLARISENPVYYGELARGDPLPVATPSTAGGLPPFLASWPNTPSHPLPLPLLKIHGSINWQVPRSALKADTNAPLDISEFWDPASNDLADVERVKRIPIIPPTWRKTAASNTVFARLLGEALAQMKRADKIVIVGYSLPSTDAYFRYLLAEALGTPVLPQIELWDLVAPAEIKRRIFLALGDRIARVTKAAAIKRKGFVELVSSNHVPDPI